MSANTVVTFRRDLKRSFFSLHIDQRIYSSVDTLLSFKWIWILPNEIRDERIRGTTKGEKYTRKYRKEG